MSPVADTAAREAPGRPSGGQGMGFSSPRMSRIDAAGKPLLHRPMEDDLLVPGAHIFISGAPAPICVFPESVDPRA
jgi:hypothetical protein